MKKGVLNTIKIVGFSFLVFFSHLFFTQLLSAPVSAFNIVFAVLVLTILALESGVVVWISVLIHYLIELYSAPPFGIILFSSTVSILAAYWLYRYVFTNRSWYTAGVLTALSILIYRGMYLLILFINKVIIKEEGMILNKVVLAFGYEILFSALGAVILFFIFSNFVPSLSKKEVKSSWFQISK